MSKFSEYQHRRRKRAFEAQNGKCGICDSEMLLPGFHNRERRRNMLASVSNLATWDHIKPRSHGGNSRLDNLHLVCFGCNQKRRNRKAKKSWLSVKARLKTKPASTTGQAGIP
ncbi:MAG: HNH endonuclease [Mesorhizobium sp.]|nr:MAG: HNH endonuclease [Mesorhizobium sp.]